MSYPRRGLIGGTGSNTQSGVADNQDYLSITNNSKKLSNYSTVYNQYAFGLANTRNSFISRDGRKLYLTYDGDFIRQYTLSTPFDITTATYDSKQWNHVFAESINYGINVSPDGRYFYICGLDRDNPIMFTASTPYDIDTLTYGYNIKLFDNIFSAGSADTSLQAFEFGDSGNKLYIIGTGDDNIQQFSLSTPYDIETQSYDGQYSFGAALTIPVGISWKPDGTRVFIMNLANDSVYEYSCSNAWDVTTGTVSLVQSESVNAQDATPVGLTFKPDGTKMYITGDADNEIDEYDLETAWDISTKTFVQVKTAVSNGSPGNISFSPDGTKMFLTSRGTTGRIDQFELSTAWDISTAGSPTFTYDPNATPKFASTNNKGYILSIECAVFGNDGMSISLMDIYSNSYDKIVTYPLVSAYDISTILNGVLGSSDDGSNNPADIKFNTDGTKCYVSDYNDRIVYQYSLTIPWIIGEGNKTYDGSLNLTADVASSSLYGIDFSPSGETLFVSDRGDDQILSYTVSTPFDLTSTVTLDETIYVNDDTSNYDTVISGIQVSPTGHKLYFMGNTNGKIFSADLIF
jgi:6-phosphogluconolactonase (cycloisomerase 2 family)